MPPVIRTALGALGLKGGSEAEAKAEGGGQTAAWRNTKQSQSDLDALAMRARAQYAIDWYQRAEPEAAVEGDALFYSPTRAFSDGKVSGREAHGMAIGVNTNGEVLAVAAPQGARMSGGGGSGASGIGGSGVSGSAPGGGLEASVFRYTPGEEADTGRTAEGITNVDDAENPAFASQIDDSGRVTPSRFTMGGASAEFAKTVAGLEPAASALVGLGRPMRAATAGQSAMAAVTKGVPSGGATGLGKSGLGGGDVERYAVPSEEVDQDAPEVTSTSVSPDENLETLSLVGDSTAAEPEPTAVAGLAAAILKEEPEADQGINAASTPGSGNGSAVDPSALDADLTAVPEPSSLLLVGAALVGIALRKRS